MVVWVVGPVGWDGVLRFGVRGGGLHFRRRGGVGLGLVVVVVLVVSLRRGSVLRLLTTPITAVRVVHRVRRTSVVVVVVASIIVPSTLIPSLRLRLVLSESLLTSVEILSGHDGVVTIVVLWIVNKREPEGGIYGPRYRCEFRVVTDRLGVIRLQV